MLRLAVAAYLARFKGSSREHTASDLRCYLSWCAERAAWPRWLRGARIWSCTSAGCRRSAGSSPPPSPGASRSLAGFYRTCVIDGLLEHSPAEHVRRPKVPAESPTLGLTHLQFEALLTAARESSHPCDFALVAMLGLLGLRIFEATGADIDDLGEEHGHRVLRVRGKGARSSWSRCRQRSGGPSTARSDPQPGRSCSTPGRPHGPTRATRRLRHLADAAGVTLARQHPHMLRHTFVTTMLDAGVDLRDVQIAARHADPRTTMRYDRARKNLDRHPNYILAAYMASGT